MTKTYATDSSESVIQELVSNAKSALRQQNTRLLHTSLSRLHELLYRPLMRYAGRFSFLTEIQKEEGISETFFKREALP